MAAVITAAQLAQSRLIARNMISKRRKTLPVQSGWSLHLAQAIGNVAFMHNVMNEIEASNLSATGDSAGPGFLSSRSKTGIDSKLQTLLTVGHDRIARTEGRDTFYELVRRLVPPAEFLRAFLFHPPHQAVALAAGLIVNAGLDQRRLNRQLARARDRNLGLDEIESSDEEDDDDGDRGRGRILLPRPGKAPVKRGPGRPRKHPIVIKGG